MSISSLIFGSPSAPPPPPPSEPTPSTEPAPSGSGSTESPPSPSPSAAPAPPPPERSRLSDATFAAFEAEKAAIRSRYEAAARRSDTEAAPVGLQSARVFDGSDAALRVLKDTVGQIERTKDFSSSDLRRTDSADDARERRDRSEVDPRDRFSTEREDAFSPRRENPFGARREDALAREREDPFAAGILRSYRRAFQPESEAVGARFRGEA